MLYESATFLRGRTITRGSSMHPFGWGEWPEHTSYSASDVVSIGLRFPARGHSPRDERSTTNDRQSSWL